MDTVTVVGIAIVLLFFIPTTQAFEIYENVTIVPTSTNMTFFIDLYTPSTMLVYPTYIVLDGRSIKFMSNNTGTNITVNNLTNKYHEFALGIPVDYTELIINTSGWVTPADIWVEIDSVVLSTVTVNSTGWVNFAIQNLNTGNSKLVLKHSNPIGAGGDPTGGGGNGAALAVIDGEIEGINETFYPPPIDKDIPTEVYIRDMFFFSNIALALALIPTMLFAYYKKEKKKRYYPLLAVVIIFLIWYIYFFFVPYIL